MWLKIIGGFTLGILSLSIGSMFWQCLKSPSFLKKTLGDYDELKKYLIFLGKEKIVEESRDLNPKYGYSLNIALWLKASIASLDKTRNILFLLIVGILSGSYFLGINFLLINIFLIILTGFAPLTAATQNNIFSDIRILILNVYKWHKSEPSECENFCNTERPKLFKNIYKIVSEI